MYTPVARYSRWIALEFVSSWSWHGDVPVKWAQMVRWDNWRTFETRSVWKQKAPLTRQQRQFRDIISSMYINTICVEPMWIYSYQYSHWCHRYKLLCWWNKLLSCLTFWNTTTNWSVSLLVYPTDLESLLLCWRQQATPFVNELCEDSYSED